MMVRIRDNLNHFGYKIPYYIQSDLQMSRAVFFASAVLCYLQNKRIERRTKMKEEKYVMEENEKSTLEESLPAYQKDEPWLMPEESERKPLHVLADGGHEKRMPGDKTSEDYMALPEGTRVEMMDGVFYDMAAPSLMHQDIAGYLYGLFWTFIMKNGSPCKPYISPADVQIDPADDRTIFQPDVMVVCDKGKLTSARVVGAPDLVVEVVTPSHRKWDLAVKKDRYQRAGVREYWIVLPEEKKILVYLFDKCLKPKEYTFEDIVPVGTWNGNLKVNFADIYQYAIK